MINGRKFGIHEIWIYQDDEHIYSKSEISFCVQTFDTIEEAQAYKRILESKYLRGLLPISQGIDCFRELTFFLEKQLKKRPWYWNKKQLYSEESPEPKIIAYARSLGWGKKQIKGNEGQGYMLYLPKEVTDEQLLEIGRLAQASFYKVIEYQSSLSNIYVNFHPHFWPEFVWGHITQKGFVDHEKLRTFEQNAPYKGKYEIWLLNKSNHKNKFRFENLEDAQQAASEILIKHLKTLWDHCFFAKNYVLDWSDSPVLLINYLKTTPLFDLEAILVQWGLSS